MPQQLAFVLTDGSAKVRSPERQLIRHHCMRRKNKQAGSRRSKREAARVTAAEGLSTPEKRDQKRNFESQTNHVDGRLAFFPVWSVEKGWKQSSDERGTLPPPPPPPSDWALFHFPEELDTLSQELMHQYFVRNPIRDPLCPFKLFGIQIDFDRDPLWCFRLLIADKLCFRAVLLLTSASNDLMSRRPLSNTTWRHLQRILPSLNEWLSEADTQTHEMVLFVVGILAEICILFGDYKAAAMHSRGISEILRLRGQLGVANRNPMVQLSLDRLNFSSRLVTKLWTPIYDTSVWKEPTIPTELRNLYHSEGMLSLERLIEGDMAAVFHNLQYITILFNKHYYDQTPVAGLLIQQCLAFVESGLIELEGRANSELWECMRLGMTSFFATTFRLPGLYEHPCCKSLTNQLQASYAAAKVSTPELDEAIDVWLMMICLISSDNMNQVYIWQSWKARAESGLSWNEIRQQLKRIMWIDSFHDELGERTFKALTARTGTSGTSQGP